MLSREEYTPYLRPFGCTFIVESEILDNGIYGWTYWRTAWGFYFYVPEVNNMCPEHRFYEILADLSQRAPKS
jgi:hypothetical protein